jgi:predicted PurR-regulated permease PerM
MNNLSQDLVRKRSLLLMVAIISVIFLFMIRNFLMTTLMAAIFSGLIFPIYSRLATAFRGRRSLASITTLLVFVLVILIPLLSLLVIVAAQALNLTQSISPIVEDLIAQPDVLAEKLQRLPIYERIEPYREVILTKVGQVVQNVGTFVFRGLSGAAQGTLVFFFHLFILLYLMFFFLKDGKTILKKILFYIPLPHEDEVLMVDRFVSVTRATLKGTLVIGLVQGGLAGVAFAIAGIESAVFWSAVMAVLSIIPGIGATLVWAPASVYLILSGDVTSGIVLAAFCALVVGSADNFLRPRLVGKDAKMHDILIMLGTLGGILLFGMTGFIIGPIVAALFVTIWEIYGTVFADVLPAVGSLDGGPPPIHEIPEEGGSEGSEA